MAKERKIYEKEVKANNASRIMRPLSSFFSSAPPEARPLPCSPEPSKRTGTDC